MQVQTVARDLIFPEGPVCLADGSVLVVEILAGRISQVLPSGQVQHVASVGGGPNGLAIGPDGRGYVCNNGGIPPRTTTDLGVRAAEPVAEQITPCIQVVELTNGKTETLYTSCDGWDLQGPNDIVFDRHGGFYFTDFGARGYKVRKRGRVLYAHPDGKHIRQVLGPIDEPNGIGLAPDGSALYVTQTESGRVWVFDVQEPGKVDTQPGPGLGGRLLFASPDFRMFDSLAVEACGNICVATLVDGAITVVSPEGGLVEQWPFDDYYTTNICFGGDDLRTAYVTCSQSGRLMATQWPRSGLTLNFA